MALLTPHFTVFFWTIFLIASGLWVYALIDLARSDFKERNDKLYFGLLIIFIPLLGTILYFAIGRNRKVKLKHY